MFPSLSFDDFSDLGNLILSIPQCTVLFLVEYYQTNPKCMVSAVSLTE